MRTRILNIVDNLMTEEQLNTALNVLNNSGLIAFPTETVYGLGCDIENPLSIREIYSVKGRSFEKPLAAHISDISQVHSLCREIPDEFFKLAQFFLPGPLSIVLKKKKTVSDLLTAGLDTIGIRYPSNKVCSQLIKGFGRPLAATSANISGSISPINGKQVMEELNNRIPLLIDAGVTEEMTESTVISLTSEPMLLRKGSVPVESIESVLGVKL